MRLMKLRAPHCTIKASSSRQPAPVALLLVLQLASVSVPAQQETLSDEAFSASATALLAAADGAPREEGEDGIVLLTSERLVIDEAGRITKTTHVIYRMYTVDVAELLGQIAAEWSPWYQDRPEIRARVISADGSEHWLDPATLGEFSDNQLLGQLLSDRRQLRAPLPAVGAGAIAEVVTITRDVESVFSGGRTLAWGLAGRWRTLVNDFVAEAPESLLLVMKTFAADDARTQETVADGIRRITVQRRNIEPMRPGESFLPSGVTDIPLVLVGTGRSWAEVARGYDEIVESKLAGVDLKMKVREILGGAAKRDEKIEALTRWTQDQVRYTGVEFKEAALVPRTPAETLERRYGDCKDKATLLVALLRAAGMDAHVALLRADPAMDVEPTLPGLEQFDHAIVHISGSEPMWIDPTAQFARLRSLPRQDQNRMALIIAPDTRKLIATPASQPADNTISTEVDVWMTEGKDVQLETRLRMSGSFEQDYRLALSTLLASSTREQLMADHAELFGGGTISELEYTDPADLSQAFTLKARLTGRKGMGIDTSRAWVFINPAEVLARMPVELTGALDKLFESMPKSPGGEHRARSLPMELREPYTAELTYRIHVPAGYALAQETPASVQEWGPTRLERLTATEKDGSLTVGYRFTTGKRLLTAAEVEAVAAGMRVQLEKPMELVQFQHVGYQHLVAGEYEAAIAELQRLVANDSVGAENLVRLSEALLLVGLGEGAQQYAREAVRREPDSAEAHRMLGLALQYDAAGRQCVTGFDREGSRAELTRALELDPDSAPIRDALGQLLAVCHEPQEEPEPAAVEEAIGHYEKLAKVDGAKYGGSLLAVYFMSGQYDKVLEIGTTLPSSDSRDANVIAAVALTQSAESAQRRAAELGADRNRRSLLLQWAAYDVSMRREYALAAALYRAADRIGDKPGAFASLALALDATNPFAPEKLSENSPDGLAIRYYYDVFRIAGEDRLRAWYLPSQRDRAHVGREISRAAGLGQQFLTAWSGFAPTYALDWVMSQMSATAEGDARLGYRVKVIVETTPEPTLFVVPEDNRYWILAAHRRDVLGERALELLEGNDVEGARQWLTWAADMTPVRDGEAAEPDRFGEDGFELAWDSGRVRDDPRRLRLAALALMATRSESAERAIPDLEAAVAGAADASEKGVMERALAVAYDAADRHEPLARLVEPWFEQAPDSLKSFGYLLHAYWALDRIDDVRRVAEARLERVPTSVDARRELASALESQGKQSESRAIREDLAKRSGAEATDLNTLAWELLFDEGTEQRASELALQATKLSPNYPCLHTLASAYAQLGRSAEARNTLLQALIAKAPIAFDSSDYYVLGRIAENMHLDDLARTNYERVTSPNWKDPYSTYELARRGLQRLGTR